MKNDLKNTRLIFANIGFFLRKIINISIITTASRIGTTSESRTSPNENENRFVNLPYVFKNIGRTFAVNALQNAVDLIIILNIKMRKIRTATVTQYGVIRGFINSLKGILWRFLAFLLSLFPSFFSSASVVFLPVSAVSFLSTFSSPYYLRLSLVVFFLPVLFARYLDNTINRNKKVYFIKISIDNL